MIRIPLPIERQNQCRERYRTVRPDWRPSGEVYEAAVRAYLRPTTRLLDLACGRGGLPEKLGPEISAIFGLDSSWQSLTEYREKIIPLTTGLAERLPYAAHNFEVVITAWLLEHLIDPAEVLAEVCRVLVPGGHFIFITPNACHPILLANRLSQALPSLQRELIPLLYDRAETDTFPVHYRANTARKLQCLAQSSGLRLIQLQFVPDPTYLAFSEGLFRLAVWGEQLLPRGLRVHLVGVFEK